jgi:hypothetical protein
MADSSDKSWWQKNVEDPYWAQKENERALYQGNPLGALQHDVGVGVEKGVYYGAKDMAVGLFEVAKWAVLLVARDPDTEKATTEAVIKGAKGAWGLAKDILAAEYRTPEQKGHRDPLRTLKNRAAPRANPLAGLTALTHGRNHL